MPVAKLDLRARPAIRAISTQPGFLCITSLATPIGRLRLAATSRALVRIELPTVDAEARLQAWLDGQFPDVPRQRGVNPILRKATAQLEGYFTGRLRTFTVAVEAAGTPFQMAVWLRTADIRFGATGDTAGLALALGEPAAERAVAAALTQVPLPIVIPRHRILGIDAGPASIGLESAITGWLLEHERMRGVSSPVSFSRTPRASNAE